MSIASLERVQEARRRLREAAGVGTGNDYAVRIEQLESPRPGGAPLKLHLGFSVVTGLTEVAKEELANTVQALHRADPEDGLDGKVMVDGTRRGIHERRSEFAPPGDRAAEIFGAQDSDGVVRALTTGDLQDAIKGLDVAVRLTSAELRGADLAARDLRSRELDVPDVIDLRVHDPERVEIEETLEAMGAIEPDADDIATLEQLIESLSTDLDLSGLDSIIDQYAMTLEQLPHELSARERSGLEASLRLAKEEHGNRILLRAGAIEETTAVLDRLGIDTEPGTAVATAHRIIAEREELNSIRRRLETRLDETPEGDELAQIERRRGQLRRRLRSQRQILAAAREQLALSSRDPEAWSQVPDSPQTACDIDGRPLPVLIEEPLIDLAPDLSQSVLSVLLRLSEVAQVVLISDQPNVLRWAEAEGNRVALSPATAWFAGEPERC